LPNSAAESYQPTPQEINQAGKMNLLPEQKTMAERRSQDFDR
jgi:hypothetical protein